MLRFIFGDDIFISYSRRDGANYAAALANELSKLGRDFSCFLDQWGASAANELSKPVVRALRRSSVLVLVGTPGATQSKFVQQEVEDFSRQSWLRAHRPILPININGALDSVQWEKLTGLHRTPETEEARAEGLPSEAVIRLIANSHSYTKRNQRVRWLSIGALVLLLASIAASALAFKQSLRAENESRRANEEKQNAINQGKLAQANRDEAEAKAREAKKQEELARHNADKANENAAEARKNAEEAKQQRAAAERNARIAKSQELSSYAAAQRDIDPDLSLALVNEALRDYTPQAEDELRQFMLRTPLHLTLRGHIGPVKQARFFNNLQSLITIAGEDPTARIWDLSAGLNVASLTGHAGGVQSIAFSPDEKLIVTTAYNDRAARLWNAQSGGLVALLTGHESRITEVGFSPCGKFIFTTSSGDRVARLWNAQSGNLIAALTDHEGAVHKAKFSPDGEFIVTAAKESSTPRLWSSHTGRLVAKLIGHDDAIANLDFSADGQFILTTTADKRMSGPQDLLGLSRKQSLNSSNIHNSSGTARLWQSRSGQPVAALVNYARYAYGREQVYLNPDGKFIITELIGRFGLPTRNVRSSQLAAMLKNQSDKFEIVACSPDGKLIVTSIHNELCPKLWDTRAGQLVTTLTEHSGAISRVKFSPNGGFIATTAEGDSKTLLWNTHTGQLVASLTGHASPISTADFSPDEQVILTTAGDDSVARLWDTPTGQLKAELKDHAGGVNDHGGRFSELLFGLSREGFFSPAGQFIVTEAKQDGLTRLWSSHCGQLIASFNGHANKVDRKIFGHNENYIVTTADRDPTAFLWNTRTGKVVAKLAGHAGGVRNVTFSPDGEFILTVADDDNVAYLWNSRSGQLAVRLAGHAGTVDQSASGFVREQILTRGSKSVF
jgi:WD40 repeat protein